MSPEALEAERIANRFVLSYLSREGFEKLARLIAWALWPVAATGGEPARHRQAAA